MAFSDLSAWTHEHVFDQGNRLAERGTRAVVWITGAMMLVEVVSGWWFNSMALLADGLHMASHALAIGLSAFAYAAARRYARDGRFAFGTWKIEVLAGFASAIILMCIAGLMVLGALERIVSPKAIHYREALVVAAIGLLVNVVCAAILGGAHRHDGYASGQRGHHPQHDLNLKSAYLHVIADAATSVLAILALAGGLMYGWAWLDPVMGIAGAALVALWARNLIVESGKVLLDREMDHPLVAEIREAIESHGDRLADLHVWRVGRRSYACALSVVTHDETLTAAKLRERLSAHEEIAHSTIEVHRRA